MILYATRKALRKCFRPIYMFLTKKKRLHQENERLKYQIDYLTTHIESKDIKGATGLLREYQVREADFLREVMAKLQSYGLKPFLDGGCLLGYYRHNGFVPWDDDIDLGLMREDFEKAIEITRKEWTFIEMDKLSDLRHPFYAFYDQTIAQSPGKIVAILSSTCLHIFKGSSLRDAVNVEIFPFDYVHDSVTESSFIAYKEKSKTKINALHRQGLKKVFSFFEQELQSDAIFSRQKTGRITYGIGNYAFTEYTFRGFLQYDDIYPLKEDIFEGVNVYIPNNPQNALACLYGDYMKLPSDVGIAHTIENINDYLQRRHRPIIDYKNS